MQTQDKEIKVGDHKNDEEEGEVEGDGARGWLVGQWPWRSNILPFFLYLFGLLIVARISKVLSLFLFLFLLIVALVPLSFLLSVPMTGQVCWCWTC